MPCYFCEKPKTNYFQYYCEECSMLRRLVLLHGERVIEICRNVLCRDEGRQQLKINAELQKEIDKSNKIIKNEIITRSKTKNDN